MHVLDVLVARLPRAGFVPVEADTPDEACGLLVLADSLCPLDHVVPVVVPHDDPHGVQQPGLLQGRAEVLADEVALLLAREEAGLPARGLVLGLVLHGHAPERQALSLKGARKQHKVLRPGAVVLEQEEVLGLAHAPGRLHPGRRAPGACQDLERPAAGALRVAQQRDDGLAVALDAEAPELDVPRLVAAAPVALGEVAGGHVDPPKLEPEAQVLAEVGGHHTFPVDLAQVLQHLRGRLREGPAEAEEGLVANAGVQDDGHLLRTWPPGRQPQGIKHGEPEAVPGRADDEDLTRLRHPGSPLVFQVPLPSVPAVVAVPRAVVCRVFARRPEAAARAEAV
mmetsp:Transcript_10922/g.32021  ORF Transcript_10922/g.32021 Transcript_10922/m.32021 type:complete len:339 (+) Transcript_10922:1234-2250(+)